MAISVFDLFTIGIGPSSSHTVGPMRAARTFASRLESNNLLERVGRVVVRLYGSLGATGRGHGTHKAVMLGLEAESPEGVDVDGIPARIAAIEAERCLRLNGSRRIDFEPARDLVFEKRESLPGHPNGMRFKALADDGSEILERVYYSVGGGFVVNEKRTDEPVIAESKVDLPYSFESGEELLALCERHGLSISALMLANERAWRSEAEIRARMLEIWAAMQACVKRGCRTSGVMPGLKVRRRAADLYEQLAGQPEAALRDPLTIMDWVNLYALAVNEENAMGGRVVTAPTNGAAGIIPAVLHYYRKFCAGANDEGVIRFLLTAGAVGLLFKRNASISGAEVGCQGEVGSACSMAAAGLTEVQGGTPAQVENAAEIAMEHNLGLTCDPIGGLVQVPCIERNAMASIKAINASRLALRGDGKHFVSLDKVIRTMRETGHDMQDKYKETSRGGLATNVIEVPVSFIEC
ncbi:MAG: L-serine ammonia-lyase [Gammaproteobacteria bacterium]|nr:L-serine ammonia-lyase [Gammaproteobacteria bacterium]MDH4253923.1 L-serine ammonia-lyase [Gammaproteobacteria bacterium]MDH5309348.1 L-serine ammonia-lyase [Gammaproteobacteria bacterium]